MSCNKSESEKGELKIAYLISTLGHGRGGHFQSLNVIGNEMSKNMDVVVINIGKNNSKVLDESGLNVINIYFNGYNFLIALLHLHKIIKSYKPTHIHCFDSDAFLFGRILACYNKGISLVLSKCGGPNPKDKTTYNNNMHFMSIENYEFFNSHHPFKKANFSLIPNRVSNVISDEKITDELRLNNPDEKTTFMHIGRICDTYKSSFKQTINLVKRLTDDNLKVRLFIVGVIQDHNVYDELVLIAGKYENITFLTSDKYTIRASKCIDSADFLIGTGRSVMEAASKGKVVLTPVKGHSFPAMLTNDNFNELFKTNFSPRNVVKDLDSDMNLQLICSCINKNELYNAQANFMLECYRKYFFITSAVPKFKQLYNNCIKNEVHLLYIFKSLAYTLKKYIRT